MRQVDRFSVGIPPSLDRDLSAEISKIRDGEKAHADIYRHNDVMTKLRLLYLDKCFLCETFFGESGVVEHFLPWHKDFPERAYDWENLNLSCDDCNNRKKQKPYRVPSNPRQAAAKTVLIDPSNPPFGSTVEELIQFNKYCEAVSGGKESTSHEVLNSINFLNDRIPFHSRHRRWVELTEVVFQSDCKTIWWELRDMPAINPHDWDDADLFSARISALERGDAIYEMFLTERAPFYSCMKYVVFQFFRLSIYDFKRMSDAFRKYKGLPSVSGR